MSIVLEIGGVILKEDDTFKAKVNFESNNGGLVTWDSLNVSSPYDKVLHSLTIEFIAGDIVQINASYYNMNSKGPNILSHEQWHVKKLNLDLESYSRIACSEFVCRDYESNRNKMLGLETKNDDVVEDGKTTAI